MMGPTGLEAEASFSAHNGDSLRQEVPITAQCGKKGKGKKRSRSRKGR